MGCPSNRVMLNKGSRVFHEIFADVFKSQEFKGRKIVFDFFKDFFCVHKRRSTIGLAWVFAH